MTLSDPFLPFPLRITVKTEGISRHYVRESDCFAVHGPIPPELVTAVLYSFDDPVINVCRGEFSMRSKYSSNLTVTPVYRLEPNGTQGVPSGRIFIRFRPEVPVESRREKLEACEFFICESLSYAPHAAWLKSLDGNIATALIKFAKLQDFPDVVLVEPQMLMRRVHRSSVESPSES
jgi:hypothetical protein